MIRNNFVNRHIGPTPAQTEQMLKVMGYKSVDELIDKTIPAAIRLKGEMNLPAPMTEYEFVNHIHELAAKNKIYRTYIGQGYYNTILPPVILRNVLENPGWYTSYTPYQAEISQGRLEALFNYQTMIADLTGMPLTNAGLLDEATSAAEAMTVFLYARSREKVKANANKLFVSNGLYPQTIDVIKTRAGLRDIEVVIGDDNFEFTDDFFGAIVQHIDRKGEIQDYTDLVKRAHDKGVFVAAATDLMALVLLKEPAAWDVDCVFGSTQHFGLPLGFGGPSSGFFACKEDFRRQIPGRIVGLTVDAQGNKAYRLALQTREQHIKRDKATSNICTSQALMAIMSGMYAIYHGAAGLTRIASDIHCLTSRLNQELKALGYVQMNKNFFDTLYVEVEDAQKIRALAEAKRINFHYADDRHVGISLDETTTKEDVEDILTIFAQAKGKGPVRIECSCAQGKYSQSMADSLKRTSKFLQQPIFNTYHSETEMMRYIKKLEVKDLSLNRAMIPLGSCTMKLNAAAEMLGLSIPGFSAIHPFVPADQAQGYLEMIHNLENMLAEITGFSKICMQATSGAAGEYAALVTIRSYQKAKGEYHRKYCLIPASAHGTNPASCMMAGMTPLIIKSTERGEVDIEDLKAQIATHGPEIACLMITYPSTHGVFEEGILEIIRLVHECGAQVFMDGANMNGQVGLTSPGFMGADACHLNLHKTFACPHGGGGPGVGPIGVAKHLVPYLPTHSVVNVSEHHNTGAVSSSPYGSAMIMTITYGYIRMLGAAGLKQATEYAILNANYLIARLKDYYKIFYTGANGCCGHEMIVDCNEFSMSADVTVGDIAKRLMDYGFHAPTVAFPVHGTLMIEPTESEPLAEMDRLVDAFISIRKEIAAIAEGKADKQNNVIKNAPHTMGMVCADEWKYPYTRQEAAFPNPHDDKYWPSCARVDDAYGDRNLCCRCE